MKTTKNNQKFKRGQEVWLIEENQDQPTRWFYLSQWGGDYYLLTKEKAECKKRSSDGHRIFGPIFLSRDEALLNMAEGILGDLVLDLGKMKTTLSLLRSVLENNRRLVETAREIATS